MSVLIQEICMNEYNLSEHAIGLARFYPHNITLQVNICMYIIIIVKFKLFSKQISCKLVLTADSTWIRISVNAAIYIIIMQK